MKYEGANNNKNNDSILGLKIATMRRTAAILELVEAQVYCVRIIAKFAHRFKGSLALSVDRNIRARFHRTPSRQSSMSPALLFSVQSVE